MKTGIIIEIKQKTAIVLQPSGAFIERPKQPEWQVGDTVIITAPHRQAKLIRWVAVAACFVFLAAASFFTADFYLATDTVISMDINPSFELELNRNGQIIDIISYNDDATTLLESLDIKWQTYDNALSQIMQSKTMQNYLAANQYFDISVYSASQEKEILIYIEKLSQEITAQHPDMQIHCNGTGKQTVKEAHQHGMSTSKWKALQDLQACNPSINIEDYAHYSTGEIREEIRRCLQDGQGSGHQGSQRHGQTEEDTSCTSGGASSESDTSHRGRQHGKGNK